MKERLSIALLADEGLTNTEIAEHEPLSAHAIGRWRKRFSDYGIKLITDKAIRRGVFISVKDWEDKLMSFINIHNDDPKPFVWTKSAEIILEKVSRAKDSLILTLCMFHYTISATR